MPCQVSDQHRKVFSYEHLPEAVQETAKIFPELVETLAARMVKPEKFRAAMEFLTEVHAVVLSDLLHQNALAMQAKQLEKVAAREAAESNGPPATV